MTGHVAGLNGSSAFVPHPSASITCFFPNGHEHNGHVEFLRRTYLEIDREIVAFEADVTFCVISEPDSLGNCTPAIAADYTETSLESANVRIAIINKNAPHLVNCPKLNLEQFTHVITHPFCLLEQKILATDRATENIACSVASLISDHSTIQIGIGKIPDQILKQLRLRKNLRLHSGILSKQIKPLAESGALAVENAICCASLIGDSDFYDWLDRNPSIQLAGVKHTHASATLENLERFVSINSAITIDLLGNVNAEWIGDKRISAPGGLPNFAQAAHKNKDGLSIIALRATAGANSFSRIVRALPDEKEPTLTHDDIDIIVTEFGIADLRGRTADERANSIRNIAAPQFRSKL